MTKDAKKRNVFQKIAKFFKDAAAWVAETFADPAIAREVKEDLGLNPHNPATPPGTDANLNQKIDAFLAKEDVDRKALAETVAQIGQLADTILTFADAVKADGVDKWDVFWLVFKVWGAESLRLRNPAGYAAAVLGGLILEDDELLPQLDPAPVTRLLKGEATDADADALIDRIAAGGGALVVLLDQFVQPIGGSIDAFYGWDGEPGTPPEAAVAASRALTVVFKIGGPVDPILTVVPVPRADGGPGLLLSMGAELKIEHDTGAVVYRTSLGAKGAFSVFFRFSTSDPGFRVFGPGEPSIDIEVLPKADEDKPFLVFGTSDGTRLELGSFSYGFELGADHAGFKTRLRKGKLVIALADGDGFLSALPGRHVEVPFELGLLADTAHGVRFDGGTGLKVNLPVAASVLGAFTVQFIAFELRLTGTPALDIRGGFSLKLGPFQASIDQIGTSIDLAAIARSTADIGAMVKFLPPKGIGLALDAGPVKGGGYLYIDPVAGEYAGALELKFLTFSIKAIALISTKRPDRSPGWSLLIFIFGQFNVHIAFGIFWTGLGGMIGLHHRADMAALTDGLKSGALDDVLFPVDPVANAPRIISRYKQLFPIETDSLLLGPMLELSFSQPPIVYVRIGLIFEVRNALGRDRPAELTKVILLGQLLVQLPPRDLGVPAIVKLLVDVVGFYDAAEGFLLIRARLRNSFIGVEGFAKLDLTGELVLAMRFGADPSFVLSAGGFHPGFTHVPKGVPAKLERMAVSYGIGPIKIRNESYVAITSNSVQVGCKIELSARISVAAIAGHLSFDALVYLSPRFHFLVQLDFQVSLKAFGRNLASVKVTLSLEGPGEWRAKGHFSFSILWWDVDIGFDESWGRVREVEAARISAAATVRKELADPARLLPGPPVGGSALVTLAPVPTGRVLAHPLALVTVAQKSVPFGVAIDRIGTRSLTEGRPTFIVDRVLVDGRPASAHEAVTDHFARGQFMELSEQQKLEGRSFETFTSGVRVGSSDYAVGTVGTTVKADYEVEILEPEPELNLYWTVAERYREVLDLGVAETLASYGAVAHSAHTLSGLLHGDVGTAAVREAPVAIVDTATLTEQLSVIGGPASSEAIATQAAAAIGGLVVEAYEVVTAT